jgi:hypothetical protein
MEGALRALIARMNCSLAEVIAAALGAVLAHSVDQDHGAAALGVALARIVDQDDDAAHQ